MRIRLLFALLILTGSRAFGQPAKAAAEFEPALCGRIYTEPAAFIGNPYFNSEWTRGDIILNSGDTVADKLLRYNGLLDELIWISDVGYRQVQLEKHFIAGFVLKLPGGTAAVFRRGLPAEAEIEGTGEQFFQVLSRGAASVYVQRAIVPSGTTTNHIDEKDYRHKNMTAQPRYIILLPDNQAVEFSRLSRRSILSVLPRKYLTEVKSIIRSKNLTLRSENHLVTLVSALKPAH